MTCQVRCLGCHSSCDVYKNWKSELAATKEKMWKDSKYIVSTRKKERQRIDWWYEKNR